MDEQFEFLRSVVQRLEAIGIPYMLTGSLALAVWARPRMTRDVDIVIEADHLAVQRLLAAFATDSYASPEAAAEAVRARTMFSVISPEDLILSKLHSARDIGPHRPLGSSAPDMIDASDTPPEVDAQLATLYQARTPAERVRMATTRIRTEVRLQCGEHC